MNGIYMIIGGNIGDRHRHLIDCQHKIQKRIGHIANLSSIYETSAWGKTEQAAFLNQVLFVRTILSAEETLKICLDIEKDMGRIRHEKWEARVIDIDLLFFNDEIIDEANLKIPHPHMHSRRFVLVPLNEIASDFIHPILKKTVAELLENCDDGLEVSKFD